MENPLSDEEQAFWDREISSQELEELWAYGEGFCKPTLDHRIQCILWNYRIKKRYRKEVR